ncbi:LAMI_0A00518g1_1 [Lachancea mirantina]|uniref:Pre-rRNA-processing protein ESF2 n=1 Tax=Lachancea mirantina TaxID=1230905 RepID=A0A1G4IL54_9SACH|nr:LAMI_0A00518g1_1 [Lachancea mirantina]
MSGNESEVDDFLSEEEDKNVLITSKKASLREAVGSDASDEALSAEESEKEFDASGHDENDLNDESISRCASESKQIESKPDERDKGQKMEVSNAQRVERIKKLRATNNTKHKTGVVYLSKIPPYMKPAKMRQVLSRFGEVDRLFLKREEEHKYKARVKGGGNKKQMFEEGWAEFIRKKDAKLCATTLNGNIVGGKKGNFYHDDVMNVKYLPGFKWADLTAQIARENDVRQAKLQLEISQANKLNAEYIRNVERSKMVNKVQSSKKQSRASNGNAETRNFKQRKVTSNRANDDERMKEQASRNLDSVIDNLL